MITIFVYLDDGLVFAYEVNSAASAREHAAAIVKGGYRRVDDDILTHYPPHRITKVKCKGPGITTQYPDTVHGT